MRTKDVKKLRGKIKHYKMYQIFRDDYWDIRLDKLGKHSYANIYGYNPEDAIERYCKKRPNLYYYLYWIRIARSGYPSLMLIEEGKTYDNRMYYEW